MADYATAVGFVQFPVDEREANNDKVRDVTIRTPGTKAAGGGALVRVTLWPQFKDVAVEEGDFIAVDGTLEARTVGVGEAAKTYLNMNAKRLKVFGQDAPAEREVVGKKKSF